MESLVLKPNINQRKGGLLLTLEAHIGRLQHPRWSTL